MTMTMKARLPNRRFSGVRFLALAAGLAAFAGAVLFHGTVFRIAASAATFFSVSPEEEYRALPARSLASRLADAEEELVRIRYQALLYAGLAEENERLERLLALTTSRTVATARVIARPPQSQYDTLLVALPQGHVVMEGDRVLFEGALIGTVVTVAPSAAQVSLFSSPGGTIDARVGEPSGIVTLKGLGGGAFTFDIPSDVAVHSGDTVVGAQNDTEIIAVVESVASDPDRTSHTVYARAPVSFSDIRFVSIERAARGDF